jgi:hypothetical protein
MERVTLTISDLEYARWKAEASHHQLVLGVWIRRAVRLVFETEIEGSITITGRPKRLSAVVVKCEWCGGGLGSATVRKRFCSDPCRVKAWRVRKRLLKSSENGR